MPPPLLVPASRPHATGPEQFSAGSRHRGTAGCATAKRPTQACGHPCHDGLVRVGHDQTLTISRCRKQYVCQGRTPSLSGRLPYRLGLLSQTNLTC